MRQGYALELDSLLLTELRNARHDFENGVAQRRSLTSAELSALTGASVDRVRARLREIESEGNAFEDGVRDRWTSAP
jgi:hypothetical protein